jgi:phosphate acetyltransferase
MKFIDTVFEKLSHHPKRIVFPEGAEPRTLAAAAEFAARKLGVAILLGQRDMIESVARGEGVDLSHNKIAIIDPANSSELPTFCERLEKLDRYKAFGVDDSRQVMINPNYFGAMMIQYGLADGLVGGAGEYSSGLLRPLLQLLKPLPEVRTVFGCMVCEVPDRVVGDDGLLFFADGAVIPEPSVEQLATIALHTGELYCRLRGDRARVAMLSFSTKGSSNSPAIQRVAAATALARQKIDALQTAGATGSAGSVNIEIDGEMQADTALDATLAARKAPGSLVAGRANVMIFPDLNSGNIAIKLVQHLANARSYGQILLGLSKPAADMSRGATVENILGVAAIVGLQAIEYHTLYGSQEQPA